jgi:hypothetical protein
MREAFGAAGQRGDQERSGVELLHHQIWTKGTQVIYNIPFIGNGDALLCGVLRR